MFPFNGKLLNAKDSLQLSVGDSTTRQQIVDGIVQALHRKRRRANLKNKRVKSYHLRESPITVSAQGE